MGKVYKKHLIFKNIYINWIRYYLKILIWVQIRTDSIKFDDKMANGSLDDFQKRNLKIVF